ncbi:YcxB family protein [Ottowia thiooxydans]|uniref:YcxB family protein n=1 Tax=Ottowia thiooxydans TaxID=219182 RepID=UPI000491C778|nr:YcxB family protein [Ottowia thiooxydans]
MTETTQARFRLTERDYVRAGALFSRPTKRQWAGLAQLLVLLLGVAVWGPANLRAAAAGGILGGLVFGLAIYSAIIPWQLRGNYRRYKSIQEEQTVSLHEDGLRFSSVDGQGRLSWDKILKWRYSPNYVLIYPMPRLYYVVPTTVVTQGFDLNRLKTALTQHVGPAI